MVAVNILDQAVNYNNKDSLILSVQQSRLVECVTPLSLSLSLSMRACWFLCGARPGQARTEHSRDLAVALRRNTIPVCGENTKPEERDDPDTPAHLLSHFVQEYNQLSPPHSLSLLQLHGSQLSLGHKESARSKQNTPQCIGCPSWFFMA